MAEETNGTSATSPQPLGLLTRTIVPSPVIRWIVPARIRHRSLNDVVFVSDNYILVHQVQRDGRLEHVYTHTSFSSRICAAQVFDIDVDLPREDDFLQSLGADPQVIGSGVPSQLLVLTLEAQTLVFAYLRLNHEGLSLCTRYIPLPRYPDARLRLSQYLAVDPSSRAIAIAAMEEQFWAYSSKSPTQIRAEIQGHNEDWCPVRQQQPVGIAGVIQQITFLQPARTDTEHIIFLAVVVDKRRTRLIWYDWWYTGRIEQMHSHDPQVVDSPRSVPHLVIPLANAAFILVNGSDISIFRNLISGSVETMQQAPIDLDADSGPSGVSARRSVWSNWCRPMRHESLTQDRDFIYLAREDGKVFLLDIEGSHMSSSFAGDMQCYVGQAFASLGNDLDPDLLAAAGDMSTGQLVSIGDWPRQSLHRASRVATMSMDLVELLPNWASVTDATVAKDGRDCDTLFISGGRQPYASLTEIRRGIEARIALYTSLGDDSRGVVAMWALLDSVDAGVIFLLATPESTLLLNFPAHSEKVEVPETTVFQTDVTTLAAEVMVRDLLVQVTTEAITVSSRLHTAFDEHNSQGVGQSESILCAAIEPASGLVLCAQSDEGQYVLVPYCLENEDDNAAFLARSMQLAHGSSVGLKSRPLALATAHIDGTCLAAVVTEDNTITIFTYNHRTLRRAGLLSIERDGEDIAESLAIISRRQDDAGVRSVIAVICGLRSGDAHCFTLLPDGLDIPIAQQSIRLGNEPIRLWRHSSQQESLVALSGTTTCQIIIDPENITQVKIENIWLTDKARPELAQERISACTIMPSSNDLDSDHILSSVTGDTVFLSGHELSFVEPSKVVSTVPRQIPTSGSPCRLLFSRLHKCWVSAASYSVKTGERRQIFPIIDFISARDTAERKSHQLQPGDEVYALLEWTYQKNEDKLHSFILVAGAAFDTSGQPRGRINFLRPDMLNRDTPVHASRRIDFDAPVFALATFDAVTLAICYANKITLRRFDAGERRWRSVCEDLTLSSRGVAISCTAPSIHITTSNNGIICVQLKEAEDMAVTLEPVSCSTSSILGISHLHTRHHFDSNLGLDLISTKDKRILGVAVPDSPMPATPHPKPAKTVFEAQLQQSIIRLRTGSLRPSWRSMPTAGVVCDDIIGVCTDGSIVGLLILEPRLWRQLFWLQRLVEWSVDSLETEGIYTADDTDVLKKGRELPVGLSGNSSLLLYSPYSQQRRGCDLHIDGDMLAGVLKQGGSSAVQDMITQVAERDDEIGSWLRKNVQAERAAVDGCITALKLILDAWL